MQDDPTLVTHWVISPDVYTATEIKTLLESNANTNTVTDAEKTVLGNTSGINTGDEPDASPTEKGIVEYYKKKGRFI